MALITYPTLQFPGSLTRMRWGQYVPGRDFGALDGSWQTAELPLSSRWACRVEYEGLGLVDRGRLAAFLAKMRGKSNRTQLWDYVSPTPLGTLSGSPTVSAMAQGVTSCVVTGSGTWLEGDKLQFGSTGPIVMAVAPGSAGGTLTFEPPVRVAIAGGTALIWSKPVAQFMLASSDWGIDSESRLSSSLIMDFIENWT